MYRIELIELNSFFFKKKKILIKTAGKWEISFLVNQQEFI